jgi:hypothetical protein
MLGPRSSSGPPPPPTTRSWRAQRKQEEELSLWRKKLVLQSSRVDVFMGYSENPMNPPQGKETGGPSSGERLLPVAGRTGQGPNCK